MSPKYKTLTFKFNNGYIKLLLKVKITTTNHVLKMLIKVKLKIMPNEKLPNGKISPSLVTLPANKLDCLSLAITLSQVEYLWVKPLR